WAPFGMVLLGICDPVQEPDSSNRFEALRAVKADSAEYWKRIAVKTRTPAAAPPVTVQDLLYTLPSFGLDDGFVLAIVDLAFELDVAGVNRVCQQPVQPALGEWFAALDLASLCNPLLGMPAAAVDFAYHRKHGIVVEIQLENGPHLVGFVAVEEQPPAMWPDIVAKHRVAPCPFALAPRRRHLVARPLSDDLSLKLRERQEDVEGEASERVRGVELLCYGHEADPLPLEDFDDPGKVQQGPAQPVHLIDHDTIDLAGADVREEPLERWAVQIAAPEATVVIALRQGDKPLTPLAQDEGFGRLALRVERIEVPIEALAGRFTGIDGATDHRGGRRA